MAYPSCTPPKRQGVKPHTRAAPDRGAIRAKARRRKAAAAKKSGTKYYTCVNTRTGHTCGTHHRSYNAAVAHRKQLDRSSFAHGRGRPYEVQIRTEK